MKYLLLLLLATAVAAEDEYRHDDPLTSKDHSCIKTWLEVATQLQFQTKDENSCSEAWDAQKLAYQEDGRFLNVWMTPSTHETLAEHCKRPIVMEFVTDLIKRFLNLEKNYIKPTPVIEDRGEYGKHYKYQWTENYRTPVM
jgi:hypothetical protein